jgi:hypothetical protein
MTSSLFSGPPVITPLVGHNKEIILYYNKYYTLNSENITQINN